MKRALLIGGPADGQVKTVDNDLTVLRAAEVLRPSICDACGIDRAAIIRPVTKARYAFLIVAGTPVERPVTSAVRHGRCSATRPLSVMCDCSG